VVKANSLNGMKLITTASIKVSASQVIAGLEDGRKADDRSFRNYHFRNCHNRFHFPVLEE